MKTLLIVTLVLAPVFLTGATYQELQAQRRADDLKFMEDVRRIICYPHLQPGEEVSMTIQRFRDVSEVRVTYRDVNGRSRIAYLKDVQQ
jgi:hypothetical protein